MTTRLNIKLTICKKITKDFPKVKVSSKCWITLYLEWDILSTMVFDQHSKFASMDFTNYHEFTENIN